MENLRGASKLLTEVAIVCTERQFANLCAADVSLAEKKYVYLNSVQARDKLCGGVINGNLPSGSVAIVPQTCSAAYLAFLLTSLPCQYMLFEQKINVKASAKITKKSVSKIVVFEVEKESEHAYGVAESLKEEMYQLYLENNDDLKYHHFYYLIADLCNILSLELYAHPMFEEMGIFIVKNWKTLVEEYESANNIEILFDGLVKSDSTLRNQIMRVHMLENNIDKYIKDHTDGLENK